MRRYLIILSLIIFGALSVSAQYDYRRPEIFYMPSPGPEKYYADKLDNGVSDNPGLQYRLQTGMHFSSISNFNVMTSWLSPKVLIPVNSKFMVEVGGMFSSSTLPGLGDHDSQHINSLITYARGIYSVNENFTIYGQVAKSLLKGQNSNINDFESITMGMEYYVTPNFRIGASITSQKGMDPFYLTSPYPYNYGRSSFGSYY